MNRNYLPPSLLHRQSSTQTGQSDHNEMVVVDDEKALSHTELMQSEPGSIESCNTSSSIPGPASFISTSVAQTHRSISFTGGVPINCQYGIAPNQGILPQSCQTQAPPPQFITAVNQYQLGISSSHAQTAQPIRLGRIDRFSRTCKLPTVQEVGKLTAGGLFSHSSIEKRSNHFTVFIS